jgi:prepilin-type N-terminal cleavage/methylation domain-containing protein
MLYKMQKQKGFTIIELIVVVAIIAVLAAIVLVNVTSYINKGKDAAIQGNLSSLVSRGVAYFENSALGNGAYNTFCTHASGGAPIKLAVEATNLGGAFVCNCNTGGNACTATSTKWCACSTLKVSSGNTFCVDSTGYKKETSNACSTRCPAGGGCGD